MKDSDAGLWRRSVLKAGQSKHIKIKTLQLARSFYVLSAVAGALSFFRAVLK